MNWLKKAQEELKKYDSPAVTEYGPGHEMSRHEYSPEVERFINYVIKKQKLDCTVDEFPCQGVNWDRLSKYRVKIPEDFIIEFADYVDWKGISYQKLSEDFIREFADRLDWGGISWYQKLSEDFIREFADKLDWIKISYNQDLSPEFVQEMQELGYL